ncbi:MAG: HAMP domain-containing protein, partial [Coriobacteriia bacterium]|nr:HAMP domain-containing protein [Coriobacteriia bacterium]
MALLKRRDSLATDLALLMLMVVMVSVTIVSAVSLAGVFDLASRQAGARQTAYKQALVAELRARLDGAEAVAARSVSVLAGTVGADVNRTALAMQYDAGIEFVDRLVVAAPDGTVISSYPTFQAPRDVSGTRYLEAATSAGPTFVYVPEESNTLWIAQTVETGGGERVVLARVRTAFLDVLVEEFSSPGEGRIALVADDEATLVIESPTGPRIDLETLAFSPVDDSDSGSVSAQRSDAVALIGRYADVIEYPGIRWHVAVLEPRLETAVATWRALAPATAALVITGALSVFMSFVFARRQVAPITHLEELARKAVTGAYVRPIEVDRTDELGRMADAFNAMAGRLNSLHDLAQLLASSSSLDQVLDGIMTAMSHIVDTEKVAVFLLEVESTRVVLARSRGLGLEEETVLPAEESGWVVTAMR